MTKKAQLELCEDIVQQRKVWVIERIAWLLMALIILTGLLGFTGHGRFSAREEAAPDGGMVVSYQRYERYYAQTQLSVRLAEVTSEQTRLRVGQDFLRKVELLRVEPEPERVELDAGVVTYVFNTNAPGEILFHYKPTQVGHAQIEIGLEGEPLRSLPQFVYP